MSAPALHPFTRNKRNSRAGIADDPPPGLPIASYLRLLESGSLSRLQRRLVQHYLMTAVAAARNIQIPSTRLLP